MKRVEITKICLHCGNEFTTLNPDQKFCSRSCVGQYNCKTRKANLPPQKCIVCGREFLPWNKSQVTCARKKCQMKHDAEQHKKKRGTYKYQKNEGIIPSPSPKKKKKPWSKCNAYERWEQMTLTELSGEIARMFPGKSFGDIRLLKEQGKLPEDFGKDVRG